MTSRSGGRPEIAAKVMWAAPLAPVTAPGRGILLRLAVISSVGSHGMGAHRFGFPPILLEMQFFHLFTNS